ncbi:MAG: hypothetical protein ACKV2T_04735 [Kofleriaceae bacterium]
MRVVAIQMQKRGTAIIAAACILLAHLASLHHGTTVDHVRDSHGEIEHAHSLADHHEVSSTPHLHGNGAESHADAGPCTLLAGLEQSTILPSGPAIATTLSPIAITLEIARSTVTSVSVLDYAPKTSPPSRPCHGSERSGFSRSARLIAA